MAFVSSSQAAIFINEIHYHPVEVAAYDSGGSPVLDLTEDMHEFIELYNAGPDAVSLAGWEIAGGIDYDFPPAAVLGPGEYLVVAKDVTRVTAVYGLNPAQVLGPYSGQLGNNNDTVRLEDNLGEVIDSVSYSAEFPWAISADALGAGDEWTGLNSLNYQYRGRSLERVSLSAAANDPANWLASPLSGPSPGRANAIQLPTPPPVVVAFSAVQASDSQSIIRSNQPVRIDVVFGGTNQLSNVSVEYFVDDINSTSETRFTLALTPLATPTDGRYSGTLSGFPQRSVVRYRFRANRGTGIEVVSPRADDPFAWHALYVSPVRASENPIYDCFISSASLTILNTNISQSPRRIILPDPPGAPRASWNANQPAILIYNGQVYDIQMRHHGSRYNRNAGRNSFKWQFPRYQKFVEGRESVFITDKNEEHRVGAQLYEAADFPHWRCQYIDLYLNNNNLLRRLQQDEVDETLYQRWIESHAARYPDRPRETLGGIFKATGVIPFETGTGQGQAAYFGSGEGPYYIGNCALPPAKTGWTVRQRCEWTYTSQVHGWKGGDEVEQLLTGLWVARGDSPIAPNPNVSAVRAFLTANFDVDTTLTYMAIRDWSGPFDNATHNYFLWRKGDGRWSMVPWDLDSEFDTATQTIFWDEHVTPQPDALRGPHWIKDSFFKAFRDEYKQKLFILNNTLLHPQNLSANGWSWLQSFANGRITSVNSQLGLGTFHRPLQPAALAPPNGSGAVAPAELQASAYAHSNMGNPSPHTKTTWIIRHAQGGYTNPVARITSTNHLTALPIPFDQLAFGETYYWKCIYFDAQDHPSLESVEASFVFGATPVTISLVPLNASTFWRYFNAGTNPPANWNQPAFDDSAWPQGAPLLGDDTGPLPEPIRTVLVRSNYVSFYFRHQFTFDGDTPGVTLRLRQVIDDGVIIYLNGVEISRTGMPGGTVTHTTTANRSVNDAVYEGPFNLPATALRRGANLLAAEVHQAPAAGNDVVFGLLLEARVPPAPGAVRLNEIMAENTGSVLNGNYAPDFIELFNSSAVPQSLEQFSLSDNPDVPGKYIFPPGTVIEPQSYLTVWCDDATNAPGLHTGFALDNDGQTVALFAVTPGGYQLSDVVTFGLQIADKTIGRVGSPLAWVLCEPSLGAANAAAALGSPASLLINEWMATSSTGPDWFELFNPQTLPVALGGLFLSDRLNNPADTAIDPLSFIAARGYRQFIADEDLSQNARHVNFRLSGGGESIVLSAADLSRINAVTFGSQSANVSEGRLPDGDANIVRFPGSDSPEASNFLPIADLRFNELSPHIELHNFGPGPVTIGGWWLSDEPASLQKYQIPLGTIIAAGGYWSVNAAALPFTLDAIRGGRIFLSHDGVYRLSQRYGPYDGHSYGIVFTSQETDFVRLSAATFGSSNAGPQIGPIVIGEINYHAPDLPGDDDDYEFVELVNISVSPVFLDGWRLRDAASFTFPPGTTLASGEHALVLGFDPSTNSLARSNFLAVYEPPPDARLFGPLNGKLDNAGDSLELVKPGVAVTTPGPDYGSVPEILIDRVNYSDNAPWPAAADGIGATLQRAVLSHFGNEPLNWFAQGISPGAPNRTNSPPTVNLIAPADGFVFNAINPLSIQTSVADSDGSVRRVQFFAGPTLLGEAASPPFNFIWTNVPLGSFFITALAIDNSLAAIVSQPVLVHATNGLPQVALLEPPDGASFVLPTNILLQAWAADADGGISKVEFFANGQRLGEDTTSPYQFLWANPTPGTRTLTAAATDAFQQTVSSAPVAVTISRSRYIAYVVDRGTIGGQNFGGALGMDFDVLQPTVISALGVFDSNADGIDPASTVTAYLYSRIGNSGTLIASIPFSAASPGALVEGSRFKPLASPLIVSNGSFTIVASGFGNANPNGNLCCNAKSWNTDDGGGLIAFVGASRYGTTPTAFPTTVDTGPVDRFAAGTFEFFPIPSRAMVVVNPTNLMVRPNSNAVFTVYALGDPPLRFQWSHNGIPLAGANSSTLTVTNCDLADEGFYTVTVTNALGSAASLPAELTLLINPDIVQPPLSQRVLPGSAVTLSVVVTNTANLPILYRWRRNGVFMTDATFLLHSHTAFFTITNAQPPFTNYAVAVTNLARPSGLLSASAFLTFLTDGDNDTLPDEWENFFQLDPANAADRFFDSDGDGHLNWQEYVAGTDPTNAASALRLEPLPAGTDISLRFDAASNKTYSLQFTPALNSTPWQTLLQFPARPTNRTETTLHTPPISTQRFYRLLTPATIP